MSATGLGDDHLRDPSARPRGWSAAARSGAPTARTRPRWPRRARPAPARPGPAGPGSTGPAGRGGRRSAPPAPGPGPGSSSASCPWPSPPAPAASRLAVDHRGQHRPRRDRGQRRGHRRQLDRGVLQHQLQPDRLPGPVAHQLHPVPGQHPQPADRRRRHERRRNSPCSSSCAIHSASRTSVLRPGTAFMCAALSSQTSITSSRQ